MKQLLYVGKFYPWTDKHDNALAEALETFDKVTIAVSMLSDKPKKGQPTKIIDESVKDKVKIIYFKRLSNLLHAKKEYKYIMFERN